MAKVNFRDFPKEAAVVDVCASYSGAKLHPIDDNNVAYIIGNAIAFMSLGNMRQTFLWGEGQGISALATCPAEKKVAYTATTLEPEIVICKYPSRSEVARLKNTSKGTKVEYVSLAFTRDGKRLVSCGGLPNFEVLLWDVEKQTLIASASVKNDCSMCAFNPLDNNQFYVGGEHGLWFFSLRQEYDEFILDKVHAQLSDIAAEEENEDEESLEEEEQMSDYITAASWTTDQILLVANAMGEFMQVDPETGKPVQVTRPFDEEPGSPVSGGIAEDDAQKEDVTVTAMILTKSYAMTATSDGKAHFIDPKDLSVKHKMAMPTLPAFAMVGYGEADVDENALQVATCIAPSPMYHKIIIGTDSGAWLEAELGFDDTIEQIASGEYEGEPADAIKISPVAQFHSKLTLATSSVPCLPWLVSAGHDGCLRVWDADQNKMVGVYTFGTFAPSIPITSIACGKGASMPIIAVGSSCGTLRVVMIGKNEAAAAAAGEAEEKVGGGAAGSFTSMGSSLKVLHSTRLHAGAITFCCFNNKLPLIATGSLEDRTVFVLDARSEGAFRVLCFAKMPEGEEKAPVSLAWRGQRTLVVVTADGSMYQMESPRPNESRQQLLEPSGLVRFAKLDAPSSSICFVGGFGTSDCCFAACPSEKQLKQYFPAAAQTYAASAAAGDQKREEEEEDLELVPSVLHDAHDKGLMCIATFESSPDMSILATGSSDGSVALWSCMKGANPEDFQVKKLWEKRLHSEMVIGVSFSEDGTRVSSMDLYGSVFSASISEQYSGRAGKASEQISQAGARAYEAIAEKTGAEGGAVTGGDAQDRVEVMTREEIFAAPSFLDAQKALKESMEKARTDMIKAERRELLLEVKTTLHQLIANNEKNPEIEKLERDEFCIDLVDRDEINAKAEEDCKNAKSSIIEEDARMTILANRLKERHWNSAVVQSQSIFAFQREGVIVDNFAVGRTTKAQDRVLEHVILQRRIELHEIMNFVHDENADAAGDELKNWPVNMRILDIAKEAGGMDYIVNADLLALPATYDVLSDTTAAKDAAAEGGEAAGGGDDDGADDEDQEDGEQGDGIHMDESLIELLYHPLKVQTETHKRRQIILINAIIREIKKRFNFHFEKLFGTKEEAVDRMNALNSRIAEILEELKVREKYFKPKWDPKEDPKSTITVNDSEITVPRYETAAEREAKRLAAEAQARRAAELAKDNMEERALIDMMHGTLEKEQKINLDAGGLDRPEWMDQISYEHMSDEQKKELELFEAKEKALREEQEKYRKELELELKKARTEVEDICRVFDDKVVELGKLHLKTKMLVLVQELYGLRLSLEILEKESGLKTRAALLKELKTMKGKREKLIERNATFKRQLDTLKEAHEELQKEDRQLERDFRTAVQNVSVEKLDAATMRTIMSLYRYRAGRRRSSMQMGRSSMSRRSSAMRRRSSVAGSRRSTAINARSSISYSTSQARGASTAGTSVSGAAFDMKSAMKEALKEATNQAVNDPFFDLLRDKKPEDAHKLEREKQLKPLDLDNDIPEGFFVSPEVMRTLQTGRIEKIKSEHLVQDKKNAVSDSQTQLEKYEEELSHQNAAIKDREDYLMELREEMDMQRKCVEVVLRLKQGQDECPQEPVVTSYAEVALIDRAEVEELNAEINKLNDEKLQILAKIKDFNKEINYRHWEREYLDFKISSTDEHYTDLHMLRVTKDLQSYIKGTDNQVDRQKSAIEQQEKKLVLLRSSHQAQLKKLERSTAQLQRKIKEKESENKRLKEHIEGLEQVVKLRESIRQQAGSKTNKHKAERQRMEMVVTRRKLIDLARAQTDEIEFLRQELDRLRQKTFPSFASQSRYGGVGPDDK